MKATEHILESPRLHETVIGMSLVNSRKVDRFLRFIIMFDKIQK